MEISIFDKKFNKERKIRFIEQDRFEVESKTTKNTFYDVNLSSNECSCPAHKFRYYRSAGVCDHLRLMNEYIKEIMLKINEVRGIEIKRDNTIDILEYVGKQQVADYDDLISRFPEAQIVALIRSFDLLKEKGRVRLM